VTRLFKYETCTNILISIILLINACSNTTETIESTRNITSNESEQNIKSSSPPVCSTDEGKMQCLTRKAIWYKDIRYCENFTNFDFYGVSDCYSNAVFEIKDSSICSKIKSNRKNKLTTEQLKTSCYFTTAHVTRDIAICEYIQDFKVKENCKDQLEIDFSVCKPDRKRIGVSFGSTTYEIVSKEGDKCIMNYGGEVENPNWDGKLTTKCLVPISFGKQIFFKTHYGVDFSPLKDFCII